MIINDISDIMKNNVDIEKGGFVTNKAGKVHDKYKLIKEVASWLFR